MSRNVLSIASKRPWLPREHSRQSTSITGFLEGQSDSTAIPCVVKDISEGGAKVIPMTSPALNEAATLILPSHEFKIPVRLRWEKSPHAGFVFDYEAN